MNREAFLISAGAFAAAPIPGMNTGIDPVGSVESKYQGLKLGVYAIDVKSGTTMQHRPDEFFPLASTVKLPVVMAVLHRVDRGLDRLDRRVTFAKADLQPPYSEIAKRYPHGGALTLSEICSLTISTSDNTGVDLLFKIAGGPKAVESYVHGLGIRDISIDRFERQLPNSAPAIDRRDTGTPRAMATLAEKLVTRSPLSPRSTSLLLRWMRETKTGDDRLRAGVPSGWRVADKTGTYHNAANDVGLLFRPNGQPIAIAVYTYGLLPNIGSRAIADVAHAVTQRLG